MVVKGKGAGRTCCREQQMRDGLPESIKGVNDEILPPLNAMCLLIRAFIAVWWHFCRGTENSHFQQNWERNFTHGFPHMCKDYQKSWTDATSGKNKEKKHREGRESPSVENPEKSHQKSNYEGEGLILNFKEWSLFAPSVENRAKRESSRSPLELDLVPKKLKRKD